MLWGDVREGDVLFWEEDEFDPFPVYLITRVEWQPDGSGTCWELSLDTGELFEAGRRAELDLELLVCVLRGGEAVWGTLE